MAGARTSLIRDYLTLPGVQTGWCVLMAFAVVDATTKIWPRIGVTFIAVFAVVAALCTTEHPMLDLLPAAVGPLLAWYATGRLPGRGERQSRAAVDAFPVVPQVGIASERVPLGRAG